MLKIRLTRVGKANSPRYRVVVAEQKYAVKGKFIEIIGHFNPTAKPKEVVIDKDRAIYWMSCGAQASDTVNNLMVDLGILDKKDKTDKKFAKEFTKKQIKEGLDKKPVEATATESTEEATEEAEAVEVVEAAVEEATPETEAEVTEEAPEEEAKKETPEAEETTPEAQEK